MPALPQHTTYDENPASIGARPIHPNAIPRRQARSHLARRPPSRRGVGPLGQFSHINGNQKRPFFARRPKRMPTARFEPKAGAARCANHRGSINRRPRQDDPAASQTPTGQRIKKSMNKRMMGSRNQESKDQRLNGRREGNGSERTEGAMRAMKAMRAKDAIGLSESFLGGLRGKDAPAARPSDGAAAP